MVSARSRTISKKRYRPANYKGYRAPKKKKLALKRYARNARIGGFLGLELKFLDCAWNGVTIAASTDGSGLEMQPSAGCTNCISCPGQGDGESQRDGRKFVIKSFWVSGTIDTSPAQDQGDAINNDGYFFALVLDTQANGATIVSENVYINPGSSGENMLPTPLRNLENSKRFTILASKFIRPTNTYALTDGTSTASIAPQNSAYVNLSWKGNISVDTTGTTADVASVSDNAVHLIACTGAGGSTFTPVFRGKSRMRFMG